MNLVVENDGQERCIYSKEIIQDALGILTIELASLVEPNDLGRWPADLSPIRVPVLGRYEKRSEAPAAKVAWMEAKWLRRIVLPAS